MLGWGTAPGTPGLALPRLHPSTNANPCSRSSPRTLQARGQNATGSGGGAKPRAGCPAAARTRMPVVCQPPLARWGLVVALEEDVPEAAVPLQPAPVDVHRGLLVAAARGFQLLPVAGSCRGGAGAPRAATEPPLPPGGHKAKGGWVPSQPGCPCQPHRAHLHLMGATLLPGQPSSLLMSSGSFQPHS